MGPRRWAFFSSLLGFTGTWCGSIADYRFTERQLDSLGH
jgi:hypothetical protein